MPELPEVETTCRGLKPFIVNQTIKSTLVRNYKLRWPIPKELPEMLQDKILLNIERRAKYILFNFSHGCLIVHLGMSGSLRLCGSTTPILKHEHVEIHFNNGQILRYHDPRRFGCMLWTDDLNNHPLIKKLGIEPLSEQFSAKFLHALVKTKNIGIKKFLMNSHYIVGIGNIYACEALFYSNIHPATLAKNLNYEQCTTLVVAIKNVLEKSIATGGTTLRDFVNTAGEPGYFAQQLAVYGRAGQNCNACNNKIDMIIIGQRRSDYCAYCQVF